MPRDLPILFSGPMVRAILDGRKSVTRRTGKRRWAPGDRLWVRETWAQDAWGTILYRETNPDAAPKWRPSIFMRRIHSRLTLEVLNVRSEQLQAITPDEVRMEGVVRLAGYGNIVGLDGCERRDDAVSRLLLWERGWDSINGKRPGCSWADNPLVWRIEFRRVE